MTTSVSSEQNYSWVHAGIEQLATVTVDFEAKAERANQSLVINIRIRQSSLALDWRQAALRVLNGDSRLSAMKDHNDELLTKAIRFRLLLLTKQLKSCEFDQAKRTLSHIRSAYESINQVRVAVIRVTQQHSARHNTHAPRGWLPCPDASAWSDR